MTETAKPIVVGLGEVLWDLLPEGKRAGGAPANFAYHAAALGARGVVVSSVGNDPPGHELLGQLDSLGASQEFVAIDPAHPTGTVSVSLNAHGDATYLIHRNVAWDHIGCDAALNLLAVGTDAVCVGTLAQRSERSRKTIHQFLQTTRPECIRVLDVNLREKGHEAFVAATLGQCDVMKLNEEEWPIVARTLGVETDIPGSLEFLRKKYRLRLAVLTRGAGGSILCSADGVSARPGVAVRVADTVGAGDAFTAAVVIGLLNGDSIDRVHRHAEEVASFVCTQAGATPALPLSLIESRQFDALEGNGGPSGSHETLMGG